jgi:hypothetical protein
VTDPFVEVRNAIRELSTERIVELITDGRMWLQHDVTVFLLGELYVRRPDVEKVADEWAESLDDERSQLQVVLDYLDASS